MAGINPDISTSSFKPLSLDEIMMVPLAKQKQEDTTQLALDEFAALESQALGSDKDYVSGQIGAFKKEAGALSDQLMTGGVDRSLINKVRGLRNRKTSELSLEGKTGQAAAAYNQYKANEKNIMNRKDLTSDQKRLGLQEALTNYETAGGAAGGGQFQDFVGASHIDIMAKGRDIAAKMTPQEIAKATGVTIDENGYYRDNGYVYKTLPAHHIEKVIKQALEGDQDLMAYAKELERLGIANAEEEILKSAQSAGNVFQRKDTNEKSTLLSSKMQPTQLDPNQGMIDTDQPWDTQDIPYQDGIWNHAFSLIDEKKANEFFVNGMLPDQDPKYNEAREAQIAKDIALIKELPISWKEKNMQLMSYGMNNKSYETLNKEQRELKENLGALRENNPVLNDLKPAVMNPDGSVKEPARPWSDKEVYDIYKNGTLKAEKTMSKVIKPVNPSSTFVKLGEDLIGSGDRNGNFATKHMKIAGHPSGGKDVIASQLDLSDTAEFNAIVRKTGKVIGFAPGHIEMPGAFAVQIELEDGSTPIVYMQNDGKPKQMLGTVSRMNEAIKTGVNYQRQQVRGAGGQVINEMVVTELNPNSKSYEAATIRSETEYTKDELDQLNFQRVAGSGAVQLAMNDDGTPVMPKVYKLMYDDEMQRSINNVTAYYDKAPATGQVLGKSAKNQ
tara:strand:- start:76813 stop:78825 length:2013 start_codon:yes stop_codon:yes gene_type:complete